MADGHWTGNPFRRVIKDILNGLFNEEHSTVEGHVLGYRTHFRACAFIVLPNYRFHRAIQPSHRPHAPRRNITPLPCSCRVPLSLLDFLLMNTLASHFLVHVFAEDTKALMVPCSACL